MLSPFCRILALLLLTLLLPLLTGCDIGPFSSPVSESDSEDNISITIWASRHDYKSTDPLRLRFTLRNLGNQTIVLESENNPVVDIRIDDEINGAHYNWSEGPGRELDLTQLTLEPGEEYQIEWILPQAESNTVYSIYGVRKGSSDHVSIKVCSGLYPVERC